jgi:hypothetical protein
VDTGREEKTVGAIRASPSQSQCGLQLLLAHVKKKYSYSLRRMHSPAIIADGYSSQNKDDNCLLDKTIVGMGMYMFPRREPSYIFFSSVCKYNRFQKKKKKD